MHSEAQLSRPDEQPVERPDDLDRNPGIGSSKGLFARESAKDAELIEGDNTFEGDLDNDAGTPGGINQDEGRTNR